MKIRKTLLEDIDIILGIYSTARLFMRETGNANQWKNSYPSREILIDDIDSQNSYVCYNEENDILGVFFFIVGNDPTYAKIYNGKWLNDAPYGVIHRIATSGKERGVANYCIEWCFKQCKNIRIDTHKDNIVMQNILSKNGFMECGIIHLANGAERIAFQKC